MTLLLRQWREGDEAAGSRLLEESYADLQRIARKLLRSEREGHSLEPSALINELYLKLGPAPEIDWQDRRHFFAMCSRIMRRLLIDYARVRNAARRGGGIRVTLPDELASEAGREVDVVALDRALGRMEALYPRECRVVELRYFCGMTVEEAAQCLEIGTGTVKRDWRFAKGWLRAELAKPPEA